MRYLAAYLLLQLGGNSSPSTDDIKKVLGSVGVDLDSEKAKKVIDELKGKNIEELIAEGSKKLASVPSGGSAPASSGSAPAAGESKATEEKKQEEEEEEEQ